MKFKSFKIILIISILLLQSIVIINISPSVSATSVSLTAISDAGVKSDTPDTNVNTQYIMIGQNLGGTGKFYREYINFSLPFWIINRQIISATITINMFANGAVGTWTMVANRVTSAWIEDEVTWNTKPSVTTIDQGSGSITTATGWKSINVTSIVQSWAFGSLNNGIELKKNTESSTPAYYGTFFGDNPNAILTINYGLPVQRWKSSFISTPIESCYRNENYISSFVINESANVSIQTPKNWLAFPDNNTLGITFYLFGTPTNNETVIISIRADSFYGGMIEYQNFSINITERPISGGNDNNFAIISIILGLIICIPIGIIISGGKKNDL